MNNSMATKDDQLDIPPIQGSTGKLGAHSDNEIVHDHDVRTSQGDSFPQRETKASDTYRLEEMIGSSDSAEKGSRSDFPKQKCVSRNTLFHFELSEKKSFTISKEDVQYVRSIVEQLALNTVNPGDLWVLICKYLPENAPERPIEQHSFVCAIEKAIHGITGKEADDDADFLLSSFFHNFDIDNRNSVRLKDLICGFSVLCSGTKSAKLSFAFSLFGKDTRKSEFKSSSQGCADNEKSEECELTAEELFYMLRSILVTFVKCCSQSVELADDSFGPWINDATHKICESIMRYLSGKRGIRFDEFCEWYNGGGFELAPWLELLDPKKWEFRRGDGSSPRDALLDNTHPREKEAPRNLSKMSSPLPTEAPLLSQRRDQRSESEVGDCSDPSEMQSQVMAKGPITHNNRGTSSITFSLYTADSYGGYQVVMKEEGVASLRQLVTESGLCRMEPSFISSHILEQTDKGSANNVLSRRGFHRAIGGILSRSYEKMTNKSRQRMFDIFTSIFDVFDRDRSHNVDAVELATGLSILCGGRKSDKLEFSFELMDEDRDGKLSQKELCSCLWSYLAVLLSIPSGSASKNSLTIQRCVERGAIYATNQVFGAPEDNSGRTRLICFEEFATWYTKGGLNVVSWLELLDLSKWVMAPSGT